MTRVRLNETSKVDVEEAQRFLATLDVKGAWTFQTFDDNHERKGRGLISESYSRFDDVAPQLVSRNKSGAGVFVSVNRTDGKGRRRENVVRVQALLLDLDGVPLGPIRQHKLKPHMITETSPGRYQCLWRVRGLELDQYEDIQRALAMHFDGDPAVALLTTLARVPGFLHQKGTPFKVRIIQAEDDLEPYRASEIIAAFPPLKHPHKRAESTCDKRALSEKTPADSARQFLQAEYTEDGHTCLHYHRGSWYSWEDTHYAEMEEAQIVKRLYAFLETSTLRPTSGRINPIIHALKHGQDVLLPGGWTAPFWLAEKQAEPTELIACRNGLLSTKGRRLRSHTPDFFNVTALPFDYEPHAPKPKLW